MSKTYKGSLTLQWYNKQKAILLANENRLNGTEIPAPTMNWINKDEALFYVLIEEEGRGVRPYWVDRNDIRVKEARPLIHKKTYKGIAKDRPGTIAGMDTIFEVEESDEDDISVENILIKGDNLLALNNLKKIFDNKPESEKIKCIYIDPPYNTGSAFQDYDDNLAHSEWLTLIRDRLILLRNLLCEDGTIWVSIDDSEVAYMRILLDEVFGRDAFIACNVWQKRYSRENRQAIGDVHEYILVYALNPTAFKILRNLVPPTEEQTEVYKNLNNDPKGRWRPIPMTAQAGHATKSQFYPIQTPSGKIHYPPEGRCWALSEETFERLKQEGRIYFGKEGDAQPNVIRYLSEIQGFVPWTWWPSNEVGHTDEAKKEMHALFGKEDAFDTPKPEKLLERIFHISTNENDIILDCFGGSGTSFAVAHKMKRKWIGVEIGNSADKFIVNRIKQIIKGTDQGGISKSYNWRGGGSFKYYHLGTSIIKTDEDNTDDFNWDLGVEFLQDSLLSSYDYTTIENLPLPEYLYTTKAKIGVQKVGSNKRVAIVSLTPPNGDAPTMSYEEIRGLYDTIQKELKPNYINLFTNRGVEIAADSKPDDLEIIKVPHAIFAELEK